MVVRVAAMCGGEGREIVGDGGDGDADGRAVVCCWCDGARTGSVGGHGVEGESIEKITPKPYLEECEWRDVAPRIGAAYSRGGARGGHGVWVAEFAGNGVRGGGQTVAVAVPAHLVNGPTMLARPVIGPAPPASAARGSTASDAEEGRVGDGRSRQRGATAAITTVHCHRVARHPTELSSVAFLAV